MMKKIILKSIFIVFLAVSITGCEDYLDVNKPSSAVDVETLEMNDLLAPIILNTTLANYYAELSFGNYTQYFGSYGYGAAGRAYNQSTWTYIYTKVLPNIKTLKAKAVETGADHYGAVAKIIEAVNLSFAVENWDNVPYSQTGSPIEIPFPEFDSGEQIYGVAMTLLNEAISTLEGSDPNTYSDMGSEDLFYGGNYDKWLRAAYTFKARLQLHMMKNGGTTAADVLASIEKGFASNSDDIQINYPDGKINPYYATNILARSTHNFHRAPNDQLISMMNGTTYPFESGAVEIDPRLPAIFEKEGADSEPWRGFMNGGTGQSSDGEDANAWYKDGGFHTSEDSPLILVTYAEAMFIKAEALFLTNGGSTTSVGAPEEAYDAYMEGIKANMNKIGVNGDNYITDAAVDVGAGGLALHHIMKEKYIANIHNTETYNDMRRYNFSGDVFKGLELRLEEDGDAEYFGQWYRRAIYPKNEENTNHDVVSANKEEPVVSIWLYK